MTVVLGILLYLLASGAATAGLVAALARARREGVDGATRTRRLMPFALLDLALTATLVGWLLQRP
jgi:hypothetical protein